MSHPPLPSPTFLALVPNKANPLTLDHLRDIEACLESGHWVLDPDEVDPRTGQNLVDAIVSQYTQNDEIRIRSLSIAVKFGANVNFRDSEGFTPWDRARANGERDIQKHLESLGGEVREGKPNAMQEDVVETLQRLPRSLGVSAHLIERIFKEKIFDSLDDQINHVPLGLHMIWGHMDINGAHIARGDNDAETLSMTDHVMGSLSSMGKKALDLEPASQFPLWCWLAQSQAVYWSRPDASDSRQRKWEGNWRSLERRILKTRYPGEDRTAAEEFLALELTEMIEAAMRKAAAGAHSDQDKKMVQPLAALLLTGILSWKGRMDGLSIKNLGGRSKAAWCAAARLPHAVPGERWDKEFSSSWVSPLAYALKGAEIRKSIREDGPLPEWVVSPWLTLLPLMETEFRFSDTDTERARMAQWMAAMPAPKDEIELGMKMISHCPQLQAALREQLYNITIPHADPETKGRPRFRV